MLDAHHKWNFSYTPIIIGFICSIILTLVAYFIVTEHALHGWVFVLVILLLAGVQAIIQLFFFMHLGIEEKPRWNLIIFSVMVLIAAVLVLGSMWIMHNLNYNVMEKEEMMKIRY